MRVADVPVEMLPLGVKDGWEPERMVAVTLRGARGCRAENVLIGRDKRVVSPAELGNRSLAEWLAIPTKQDALMLHGPDFSLQLQCWQRHAVVKERAAELCTAEAMDGSENAHNEDEDDVVLGYFDPSTSASNVVAQLLAGPPRPLNRITMQPFGLPFALHVASLDELKAVAGISIPPRLADALSPSVWGSGPAKHAICVDRDMWNKHGLGADARIGRVRGWHEYYHYLHDGERDQGWGCAYRALQTQCSWLRLQGWPGRAPGAHEGREPTLRETQQALYALGDKEAQFVGSREWIGAVELALLLHEWYGVDCRLLRAGSGAELARNGDTAICEAVCLHLEQYGTPVMVGGGVLAWTILGVALTEREVRYLILDPHYTGQDDSIRAVAKGGWCAWQKASVFRNDVFYNLCCPLVE